MDRYFSKALENQYYNIDGSKKKSAIYCQQIDRYILVDEYDLWITMKTAQILSSKLATTVYQLPENIEEMNTVNCMDYSVFNKTLYKRKNTAELIQNQTPTLKKLSSENIIKVGIPEDYKTEEGSYQLKKLKNYVDYVNKVVYAVEFANARNWIDNKSIADALYPQEWNDIISSYKYKSESGTSVFNDINTILYFSNDVEEARNKIQKAFENALDDNDVSLDRVTVFYKFIKENNPFKHRINDLSC